MIAWLAIRRLLGAVPWWGYLGALALAWAAVTKHRLKTAQAEAATATASANVQAKAATDERDARGAEFDFADRARKAADAYRANLQTAHTAADRSRTELERLRVAIASAPSASAANSCAAPASGVDVAADVRAMFGACATSLQDMAKSADADAARLTGLQDYVRSTQPKE